MRGSEHFAEAARLISIALDPDVNLAQQVRQLYVSAAMVHAQLSTSVATSGLARVMADIRDQDAITEDEQLAQVRDLTGPQPRFQPRGAATGPTPIADQLAAEASIARPYYTSPTGGNS